MTITIKHYGVKHSTKTKTDGLNAKETLQHFINLMLGAGWPEGAIDDAIMELNEEIDL
tara:strand:- start:165 stop:338 length:174 start_codon:yes stop_codon:yes gene_type:complete